MVKSDRLVAAPLLEQVKGIDISINAGDISKYKQLLSEGSTLLARFEENQRLIELDIQHFASLFSKKDGTVPLMDLILQNDDFLRKYGTRTVSKLGLEFTEYLRKSTPYEQSFVRGIGAICKGKIGEFLQIIRVGNDNRLEKYLIFSGDGAEVCKEDIENALPDSFTNSNLILIVHNHPNLYRDTKVQPTHELLSGHIANIGLSRKDIKFADKLYVDRTNKSVPTIMLAVCEGLTYSYIAGTSKQRDVQL